MLLSLAIYLFSAYALRVKAAKGAQNCFMSFGARRAASTVSDFSSHWYAGPWSKDYMRIQKPHILAYPMLSGLLGAQVRRLRASENV
jgi:hypothetical protein